MKILWPSPSIGPLGSLESPTASSTSHSSLLSLCLSVYSAGCVRKSGAKRFFKNEISLPKGFDWDEVNHFIPILLISRSF